MSIPRRAFITGLGISLFAPRILQAKSARPTVRMAYLDEFRPFNFRISGRMTGDFVNQTNSVFDKADINATHQGFPWLRSQKYVRTGAMDGFCTIPTIQRLDYAFFTKAPLIESPRGILFRKDDQRVQDVETISDLKSLYIGDYLGNEWSMSHLSNLNISWIASQNQIIRMISLERLDGTIGSEQNLMETVRFLRLENELTFKPLPKLEACHFHIGIRKTFPNAKELIEKVDEYLDKG